MSDIRRLCALVAQLSLTGFVVIMALGGLGLLTARGFATFAPYVTLVGLVGIGAFCAWILIAMGQRAAGDRPLHRDDAADGARGMWTTDD